MTLNDYQQKAMTTCMPSSENFNYMMLNLIGEVGEFVDKASDHVKDDQVWCDMMAVLEYTENCGILAKMIRKGEYTPAETSLLNVTPEQKVELQKEAGDILWQLSGLCQVMGWTLEDVAQQNLDKLAARKQAGTIDGNGDNR